VKTTPGKILAHGRNKLATSAHTQGRGHKLLWCAIESHEQELDRAIARIKEQQNGETNRTGRQLTGERKTRRKKLFLCKSRPTDDQDLGNKNSKTGNENPAV
jgi:hypothetical protein